MEGLEYTVRIVREAETHTAAALLWDVMPTLSRLVGSLGRLGDADAQKKVEEVRQTLSEIGNSLKPTSAS